ncbi:restriction endonuclease subunit S [Streptacidiphilus fuscans]|uniref:Restriction endonuclease subunit S n=1 Tax=Streptacidiphilus fuscans TaxID=2789292 RepID=A0A931B6Y4_9ACTN|nr:restriction endonuclease subunit S [Streptacidiphilus fuscans]MBF9072239.1 restriction endonuclease subunit S [Streptacidiphilus fuscans]
MSSVLGISLPADWLAVPLKHLTQLLNRGTAPDYAEDGVIYAVSQAANQEAGLDWSRTRYHAFSGDPRKIKGYLHAGDVLVNSTGTGTLGRVGYFTGAPEGAHAVADGHLTVARTHGARLDSRYLYYWLACRPFQEYVLAALAVGATNQIELNRDRLGSALVPLPPLAEQRGIADFLDAETSRLDRLAAVEARLVERLAERREASVIAAVSGRHVAAPRRDTRVPWLDSLPEVWDEAGLSLLARMGSGHTPSRSRPEWWQDCTIPWITTGEVKQVRNDRIEKLYRTREKISQLGMENSAAELRPAGTVFLCRTASAGYSGIMGLDMATSQDFATWTCGPRLSPEFLLWCLRAMRRDLLGRLAMGSTHKTIYVPDLQMLRVPLPPLGEQLDAVASIRAETARIDSLVDKVTRQLDLLAERRQALITAAVTGQFDVSTASGRGIDVS